MTITSETETEAESELESETETEEDPNHTKSPSKSQCRTSLKHRPRSSKVSFSGDHVGEKKKVLSQHDLLNKYFRRDTVVVKNLDLLRSAVSFAKVNPKLTCTSAPTILCSQ